MPEVEARRALSGRIGAFSVLAPVGPFAGKGILRVLRVRALCHPEVSKDPEVTLRHGSGQAPGETIELICGYESYGRIS